jgi:nitroreductase
VIQDPAVRAKLLPVSWKQKQVVEASHFVVLTIPTHLTEADVDRFIARTAEVRKMSTDSLQMYRDMMVGDLVKGPRHAVIQEWAARQVYIALGQLMVSAALLGIDACPMEGFDPIQYDQILGLPAKGLKSVVACALGYRSTTDKYATAEKVRYPKEHVLGVV